MSILVTGGAGFLGSHLMEALVQRGHEVACLDNFDPFYSPLAKRRNIEPLVKDGRIRLYEGDVRDQSLCEAVLRDNRVRVVYHLAARPGPRPSVEDPMTYQDVNCRGTLSILEACRRNGVERFVFASSSSVYGAGSALPFSESEPAASPLSPYGATKRAGEIFCYTYHHLAGFTTFCLRFFSVYGPRLRPDMAIYKFTELLTRGKAVPVYGDDGSSRDYTFYTDIVSGMLACLTAEAQYEIVNLGDSRAVTLSRMIELLSENLGVEPRFERLPKHPGDPPHTCADISKARRLFGYQPSVRIEEGIKEFVAWYKGLAPKQGFGQAA